jgi:hypothetical protein
MMHNQPLYQTKRDIKLPFGYWNKMMEVLWAMKIFKFQCERQMLNRFQKFFLLLFVDFMALAEI